MPVVLVEYDTGDPNLPNPSSRIADLYEDASDLTEDQSDDESVESDINESWMFGATGRSDPPSFPNTLPSFQNRRANTPKLSHIHKLEDISDEVPVSPRSKDRPISGIMLKASASPTSARKSVQFPPSTPVPDRDKKSTRFDTNTHADSAKIRRRYSTHTGGTNAARRKPGWEPGIDLDTTDVIIESIGSAITIVDYSNERCKLARIELYSDDALNMSDDDDCDPDIDENLKRYLESRPKWSKVRWINVNGLSKKAIYTVGQCYKLHKLAVEDMIDIPQRTKVDEYPLHTFCCLPLHRLVPYKPNAGPIARYTQFTGFFKHFHGGAAANEPTLPYGYTTGTMDTSRFTTNNLTQKMIPPQNLSLRDRLKSTANMKSMYQWNNPTQIKRSDYLESRRPLASRHKMVGVEQVSLFLTHESTVISFFEGSGEEIEKPILERLETDSTILRESCDPSILLQAIIDAIVDLLHPIVAAYRARLSELELAAILNPSMAHTRDLHLINADLTVLRNSVTPVTLLINSLRDHASNNRKGISSEDSSMPVGSTTASYTSLSKSSQQPGRNEYSKISDYASIYLADVADHTLSYTQDLDIMRNNTKSMIDLIFNTISIQSSDAVKLLSLVTVIFLPLSFLTGYFGMNFTEFDALSHGVAYYWGIAVPCSALLTILLMYPWVRDNLRKINQLVKRAKDHQRRRGRHKKRKKRRQIADA